MNSDTPSRAHSTAGSILRETTSTALDTTSTASSTPATNQAAAQTATTRHGPTIAITALFVLLWSSGAIFSKLGLQHASPFAFLVMRFALALVVVLGLGIGRGQWRPERGTAGPVVLSGLLMLGGYACCYLLALVEGLTPGVLATLLGVQPILTLLVQERRFNLRRLGGLTLALLSLALVVGHSIAKAHFSTLGILYALAALGCVTAGAMGQKKVKQSPWQVLPLQYGASLLLCGAIALSQSWRLDFTLGFFVAWLWLGLVISVVAQLLFYYLLQKGSLVNVTSVFYLVPVATAALDYCVLGNGMSTQALLGMFGIIAGLVVVFRTR